MDTHNHQEKDFLAMFPNDHHQHGQMNMYTMQPYAQQALPPSQNLSPQLSMEMLNNLMSLQGIDSQPTSPASPQYNAQTLLEQQFKLTQLQQLQQLQNQIFQQQIALISSQTGGIMQNSPSIEPRRDQQQQSQFNALPTPGPSAEIPAQQPSMEFVSPMVLNNSYMDAQARHESYRSDHQMPSAMNTHPHPHTHSHTHPIDTNFIAPRGSTSAPEHIAFRNLSPAEVDFDISPLTSPWLGAHQHQQAMGHFSATVTNKRSASSSGDETNGMPSRKRQSPAIRPTMPGSTSGKKYVRASKSTNSTPLIRSTRSRKGSIAGVEVPGDSPSPVDLSMPPPAPPTIPPSSSVTGERAVLSSPEFNPHLTPVTPASIMNLGRLGINNCAKMAPPTRQVAPSSTLGNGKAAAGVTPTAKLKAAETARGKTTRKTASGASPSLKAILPAGSGPHPMHLSSPTLHPTPVVQVRKTSHKAAEQKRRDSLKTTFDDLRMLLPPIPLPTDEKFPVEEILPGALPPRGPPKAGGEGPNKGVSKLQLLMCGNEYIRVLKARVERRDVEIERLKSMVTRMKLGVAPVEGEEEMEELDLDRDLDAVEALGGGTLGMGVGSGSGASIGVGLLPTVGEDDMDDDPGED